MTNSWKEYLFGILTPTAGIAAMWFWARAIPSIIDASDPGFINLLLATGLLMVAAIYFSLSAMFIHARWLIYGAVAIGASIPYFFIKANTAVVVGLIVSVLFALLATHRIRSEFMLSAGFSAYKILRAGLAIYFTIAAITISFFYVERIDPDKLIETIFPRPALDFTLKSFARPIQQFTGLPQPITPEDTVDDLLHGLILSQLKKQGIAESDITEKELNELIATQRNTLAEQYNLNLNGDVRLTDALYENIGTQTEGLLGPYKKYFPFASAVIFFLAIKALTWPLYYLTLFVVFLSVKIMIATQFIQKQKKQIEIEQLTF